MYRFSRGRTRPQAILMLCSLLMFIVVAINIFVYLLIPQYAIYGDQHYSITGVVSHLMKNLLKKKALVSILILEWNCNNAIMYTIRNDW